MDGIDGIDPLEQYEGMIHEDPEEYYPEGVHPGIPGLWKNPYFKKPEDHPSSESAAAATTEFDDNVHEKVHKHFSDYAAQVDDRQRHHGRRLSSSASSTADMPHHASDDKHDQHAAEH
ncbi:hypothetical protein POJ06DRAFT_39357 [Lipomyces tetrasporus]|uniref:Uncharacterized protein n=1 Tax=Lipomyces tetrasporus TaxID=54092 RepID=A0AAD7QKS3_9ASCO|nr:uncharacterized protein POJ06DRAFT_39357 [Lipomyces tetrasporus]KAJ8097084.1 hypothetical protein POJ06DRAFT_39357 [Lipomyces tetrasporus]